MTENEAIGLDQKLNGDEFEQTPGDGEGIGSLAWGSPWNQRVGHDLATQQLQ